MLVWLLQFHKQVRVERLAACLPLPILYESRRRHVQRFLALPQLSIPLLWFPLIKCILLTQIQPGTQVIIPLDRTQWKQNNLFVVSVIWDKRAWPIYWQFLSHTGSSNLAQQQALLRPVLRLLKGYELVVVGDREFRSVELAYWLKQKKVYFALRQIFWSVKKSIWEGEVYLALPPLAIDYHSQEQRVQQSILNKPVNKPISFRRLME
jgi:hypothetical protein